MTRIEGVQDDNTSKEMAESESLTSNGRNVRSPWDSDLVDRVIGR